MKNRICILYTCDDAYLPLTGISMASVIENNHGRAITFLIATENENGENLRRLKDFYRKNKDIEIRYLDCRKYDPLLEEKGMDRWGSASYYVYWKLFAYDELDEEKVWYLDSDAICMDRIDFPETDKAVGAVLDSAHACFNRAAHIDEDYYFFNTGSLYVNVEKWKEQKCTEKVCAYLKDMKHKPLMCDQDILAIALQDDIGVIDPKYDFLAGYDYYGVRNSFEMYSLDKKPFYREEEILEARKHVVFYHCLGGVFGRPWEKENESPAKEEFAKYRRLSAWPEFEKDRNMSLLFKAEKMLEVLPDPIYNKVHNLAMRIYVERLGRS